MRTEEVGAPVGRAKGEHSVGQAVRHDVRRAGRARRRARRAGAVGAAALTCLALAHGTTGPATADSAPTDASDPATPTTITADALPTIQIDGVGLTQVVIGTTVYVGGTFSTVRPPGAAPGERTVPQANLLAYDLTTGRFKSRFRPQVNGSVLALAASPDGKRLYAGGSFTRVNGSTANRIVALDPTTGRRHGRFKAGADRTVRAIAAGSTSVWLGGDFTKVRGKIRSSLAKLRTSDGLLRTWAPQATGGSVTALALSRDQRQVMAGGRFTRMNGSSSPGYGLARLDGASGRLLPLPANRVVRNGGNSAGITSLVSDGTYVYGSGFAFGYSGGNLEGTFAMRWSDGKLRWVASCHGDTYSVYPTPRAVYTVSHTHHCANIGGFPDTDPREYHYAAAFSSAVTGTNAPEPPGSRYYSFGGRPAPSLLTWFPRFDTGNTTASAQGPWDITGRGRYVAVSGEFRNVNGTGQQGLVRFATTHIAEVPNLQGPRATRAGFSPTATTQGNDVTVRWKTAWDRDNARLDYELLRIVGTTTTVVGSLTRESSFWDPQELSLTDTGLAPGNYSYRVRATDPFGNVKVSPAVKVSVS